MPYRLKYDPAADAVHDAMPAAASERLTLALADVCHDPLGHSVPYGVDDEVVRMVIADQVFAVILIGEIGKTVTVLRITYLD